MSWNKKKDIIALMVGHGTTTTGAWDCGCTYGAYNEAALMLKIVKVATKWLRKSGVRVLTDSDTKNNKNMTATVAMANRATGATNGVKYYIPVHCDYSLAKSGIMYYYGSAEGKKIGDYISKYVAKKMGMKFKGGVKDTAKYEVGQPKAVSVLYESGAIKADIKKLKDYKTYGKVLARAICSYIGVEFYVSNRVKMLRKTAYVVAYMNKHHFKYTASWKNCGMTWKQARKLKRSNCSCMISYGAQLANLLEEGQIFWFNNKKIACKGKGTKSTIKKNFSILYPNKTPKKAGLKKGDCTCSGNAHTQQFARWDSKKRPRFYSWGPSDVGKKQPRHKKSYDSRKITIIMRPKG